MSKSAVARQSDTPKKSRNARAAVNLRSKQTISSTKKPSSKSSGKPIAASSLTQHVVKKNDRWIVQNGPGKILGSFVDKSDAIDAGRRKVSRLGPLLVHGPGGQIFQHSPAASNLGEDAIRRWVRTTGQHKAEAKRSSTPKKKRTVKK